MLKINDYTYYKITEIAELADVNARTLRRWIANGNLEHFLFAFKNPDNNAILFRLEPPMDTDVLVSGEQNIYQLPERKLTNE